MFFWFFFRSHFLGSQLTWSSSSCSGSATFAPLQKYVHLRFKHNHFCMIYYDVILLYFVDSHTRSVCLRKPKIPNGQSVNGITAKENGRMFWLASSKKYEWNRLLNHLERMSSGRPKIASVWCGSVTAQNLIYSKQWLYLFDWNQAFPCASRLSVYSCSKWERIFYGYE